MAHACRAEHIERGAVKQPQLILSSARGDVEALARGVVRKRSDPCRTGAATMLRKMMSRSSP